MGGNFRLKNFESVHGNSFQIRNFCSFFVKSKFWWRIEIFFSNGATCLNRKTVTLKVLYGHSYLILIFNKSCFMKNEIASVAPLRKNGKFFIKMAILADIKIKKLILNKIFHSSINFKFFDNDVWLAFNQAFE